MTKYLFFLLILVIPPSLAYAESGSNYDSVDIGNGLVKTTILPYDRILINGNWQNYNFIQDGSSLSFESGETSFKIDKTTCDFQLYEKGRITKQPVIDNYNMDYFTDNVKVNNVCTISPIDQRPLSVDFKTTFNGIDRVFHLGIEGIEWTSNFDNTNGKNTTYRIVETFPSTPDKVEGDKLFFGDYVLDLKNSQHNSIQSIISDKDSTEIIYEKTLADKEKFSIDPTFTSTNPTLDEGLFETSDNDICDSSGVIVGLGAGGAILLVGRNSAASADECYRSEIEYDVTAIPDGSTIQFTHLKFDVQSISGNGPDACDWVGMETRPSVSTVAAEWASISSDTVLVNADTKCDTPGNNIDLDLGGLGHTYVQNKLVANWVSFGIKADTEGADDATVRFAIIASEDDGTATPPPTLEIIYGPAPDAVTSLVASNVAYTTVSLNWTAPNFNGGTLTGYRINDTTPWGQPLTVLTNNTASSVTTAQVTGLTHNTQYSFRVTAVTSNAGNMSGNIANITTLLDPSSGFTIGTFTLNATGTDQRPIAFERDDINATALFLNVTYSNAFNLACDFQYKFANTNTTYTSLASTVVDSDSVESSFQFTGVNNEVIGVRCWDQITNTTGRYVITQTSFPLLTQIASFRAGDFGTSGDFGALDLITIFAIIASMVGMNRVNESVGVIFGIVIFGGLSVAGVFGVVDWPPIMTAGIALVVMLAIARTRQD